MGPALLQAVVGPALLQAVAVGPALLLAVAAAVSAVAADARRRALEALDAAAKAAAVRGFARDLAQRVAGLDGIAELPRRRGPALRQQHGSGGAGAGRDRQDSDPIELVRITNKYEEVGEPEFLEISKLL